MESVSLEMEDIYDNEGEGQDFAGVPDLEEDLEPMMRQMDTHDDDEAAGDGDGQPITDDPDLLEKLKSMKGASKNTVKRVMPKLDVTRLTGERGIPILPKIFEKVPLKGKHHEVEDLKNIMRTLEHWGHRLFPKMPFNEVLDRCEKLGMKKPVQTCVKRIRLDMEVLPEFVREENDEDQVFGNSTAEADDVHRSADVGQDGDDVARMGEDRFETEIDEDEIEDLLREQAEYDQEKSNADPAKNQDMDSEPTPNKKPESENKAVISDEVKARIEKNKKLAMERRAAKLTGNISTKDNVNQSATSSTTSDHIVCNVSSQPLDTTGDEVQQDSEVADSSEQTLNSKNHQDKNQENLNSENPVSKNGFEKDADCERLDISKERSIDNFDFKVKGGSEDEADNTDSDRLVICEENSKDSGECELKKQLTFQAAKKAMEIESPVDNEQQLKSVDMIA